MTPKPGETKYQHTLHSNGSVTASKVKIVGETIGADNNQRTLVISEDGKGSAYWTDTSQLSDKDYGYRAPDRD